MYINPFIMSKEFSQGIYSIKWRYHVDEYGTYWYNFDDIVETLAIKWKVAVRLYKEFLNDDEKMMFEDTDVKHGYTINAAFISSSGFDRLLEHESERCNRVKDAKLRLEYSEFNEELKKNTYKLCRLVNQPLEDHREIIKAIDELYYSDYRQNAVDNCNSDVICKNDELKDLLIKAYDEDRLLDFTIEEEEGGSLSLKKRKVTTYKRKSKRQDSTCPSWLRNVVK